EELQDHLGSEKALKMDVVPRGLPVVERFDVLDRHVRLGLVANNGAEDLVLGLCLRCLVSGIVKYDAVAVAEDVVANPAEDLEIAIGEHGSEDSFDKGLAGFAV